MRREDDQQLWDLLGRAAQPPRASDFFARDVVRRIRQEPRGWERFQRWTQWLIPATAAAVVLIGTVIAFEHPFNGKDATPDVVAQIDPQDFEVVADLDVLVASDESNLWDDDQNL